MSVAQAIPMSSSSTLHGESNPLASLSAIAASLPRQPVSGAPPGEHAAQNGIAAVNRTSALTATAHGIPTKHRRSSSASQMRRRLSDATAATARMSISGIASSIASHAAAAAAAGEHDHDHSLVSDATLLTDASSSSSGHDHASEGGLLSGPLSKSLPRDSALAANVFAEADKPMSISALKKKGHIFKCESCTKVYRHPSCLVKHRWEHSPHWQEASKFLLSKHQQVQLLEAAAILSHVSAPANPATEEEAARTSLGTSLPDDRSLWPFYVSKGRTVPASTTRAKVGGQGGADEDEDDEEAVDDDEEEGEEEGEEDSGYASSGTRSKGVPNPTRAVSAVLSRQQPQQVPQPTTMSPSSAGVGADSEGMRTRSRSRSSASTTSRSGLSSAASTAMAGSASSNSALASTRPGRLSSAGHPYSSYRGPVLDGLSGSGAPTATGGVVSAVAAAATASARPILNGRARSASTGGRASGYGISSPPPSSYVPPRGIAIIDGSTRQGSVGHHRGGSVGFSSSYSNATGGGGGGGTPTSSSVGSSSHYPSPYLGSSSISAFSHSQRGVSSVRSSSSISSVSVGNGNAGGVGSLHDLMKQTGIQEEREEGEDEMVDGHEHHHHGHHHNGVMGSVFDGQQRSKSIGQAPVDDDQETVDGSEEWDAQAGGMAMDMDL